MCEQQRCWTQAILSPFAAKCISTPPLSFKALSLHPKLDTLCLCLDDGIRYDHVTLLNRNKTNSVAFAHRNGPKFSDK